MALFRDALPGLQGIPKILLMIYFINQMIGENKKGVIADSFFVGIPGFEPGTLPPLAQERGGMRYLGWAAIQDKINFLFFFPFKRYSN